VHHWLAADAGAVGEAPVEGLVCGIGSAGRFSQPANPLKAASNNTGIATLRMFMVSTPGSERRKKGAAHRTA
jgi:hypothetical protein